MEDFIINVASIEEMQMLNDQQSLDLVFQKAQSAIVCGASVVLERKDPSGRSYRFETFSGLDELKVYKKNIYKLLKGEG